MGGGSTVHRRGGLDDDHGHGFTLWQQCLRASMIVGGAQSLFETGTLPSLTTFLSSSPSLFSSPIPEPATWLLLGTGVLILLRRMAHRETL